MTNDPRQTLSRTVINAVESTPAYEAMFAHGSTIPNTWGNIASQLVEEGHVEPTVAAVTDFLDITPEDLNDPTLYFTQRWSVDSFQARFTDKWVKRYQAEHEADHEGFVSYLGESLQPYEVDQPDGKADEIQLEIDRLAEEEEAEKKTAEVELAAKRDALSLSQQHQLFDVPHQKAMASMALCLKRDALHSGVAVPMLDFVRLALEYEGPGRLDGPQLVAGLGMIIGDLNRDYFFQRNDVPLADLVLGKEQIKSFMINLKWMQRRAADQYAQGRWQAIEHIFYAGDYQEHPHFSGIHGE